MPDQRLGHRVGRAPQLGRDVPDRRPVADIPSGQPAPVRQAGTHLHGSTHLGRLHHVRIPCDIRHQWSTRRHHLAVLPPHRGPPPSGRGDEHRRQCRGRPRCDRPGGAGARGRRDHAEETPVERMAASVPRHTLTMRRRQSAPKTGGDLDQLFDTWSQDRYQRPLLGALRGEVLLVGGDTGVADHQSAHRGSVPVGIRSSGISPGGSYGNHRAAPTQHRCQFPRSCARCPKSLCTSDRQPHRERVLPLDQACTAFTPAARAAQACRGIAEGAGRIETGPQTVVQRVPTAAPGGTLHGVRPR